MSRYMDADALKASYVVTSTTTNSLCHLYVSVEDINSAPSIDIVRCRECKNNGKDECPMRWWNDDWQEYETLNEPEGFCNFGEREGE